MRAIDGHQFNVAKSRGFATTGKGSMTKAFKDPVVAKAAKESDALRVAFKRLFNEVLNARRPVNARMEEFLDSQGLEGRVFVAGPLAQYLETHRVGLMVIREYRHRSPEPKDNTWEYENVILPKVVAGKDLTKPQKMILWLKSEMPRKELMRLTDNFGKRMSLRGKSREEVLRDLFPDLSLSQAMIEFKEEFMHGFGEARCHGNIVNVPEEFEDHDPGVEDEANLEVDLFYERIDDFLDNSEEEIEEDE
jgi:hypothetical protein